MESRSIERRRGRRIELAAPVQIRRGGSAEPGADHVTDNLSVGGVYFETEAGETYQVDDIVTASVSVPEPQRRSFPFTRLAGRCRVVRVSPLPSADPAGRERFGIALEFSNDATVLTASPPWG